MLSKILVATDGSQISHYVFEQALMLAQATNACLGLLHVTDPDETGEEELPAYLANIEPYLNEEEPDPRCFVGYFEEFEKDLFGVYLDQATSVGVSTECIHCFGDPEKAICDFASVWKADLIVIGRRGRGNVAELFLGSVSNYAVHHAPCSVYVVHNPPKIESEATP